MAEEIKASETRLRQDSGEAKEEIPFDDQWSGASYYSHAQGRRVYPTFREMRSLAEANRVQARMALDSRQR